MRLSDTLGDPRDLAVKVGRGELHVKYMPLNYTPAQIDDLNKRDGETDAERIRRVSQMVNELVVEWDLTFDDETPVPLDVESIHNNVGIHTLTTIIKAVQTDQSAGEEDAS